MELPAEILFVEQGDPELTDKPHCGDCFGGQTEEVTDKPHCGDCVA